MQLDTPTYAWTIGGYVSTKSISGTNLASIYTVGGDSTSLSSVNDIGGAPITVTLSASDVVFDGSGTRATLSGNVLNMNGFPSGEAWFEWGYASDSFGHSTSNQAVTTTGFVSENISHFDPGRTVYFRCVGAADGRYTASGVSSFTVGGMTATIYRLACLFCLFFILAPLILSVKILISQKREGILGMSVFGTLGACIALIIIGTIVLLIVMNALMGWW